MDFILIFKQFAETWSHDRVPEYIVVAQVMWKL